MTISKNPKTIQSMFNLIAEHYDFNNNLISLGLHKILKYISVKNLHLKDNSKILDTCTGTGDLAIFMNKINPNSEITGIDFCENMIKIAKHKTSKIKFIQADCTDIPFPDNHFDIVTNSFGLRNIENYEKAIKEISRVLKSKGEFLHLDFGKKNIFSKIFDLITLPLIKLFYGNHLPYEYLIKSKKEFPSPENLVKLFEQNGFKLKCRKDFLFGIISTQIMQKF